MAIMDIMGLKDMDSFSIYLENSLVTARNRTKKFKILKDKVQQRLMGWNKHFNSKAGKAMLIKSVVKKLPTYTISTFKVPIEVCKEMDKAAKSFWWSSNSEKGDIFGVESLG